MTSVYRLRGGWKISRGRESLWASFVVPAFVATILTAPVGILASGLDFVHEVVDPSPPSGTGCCLDVCGVGDIDGDGIADIMVGSENSVGVVWYRFPDWTMYTIGTGSFTTDGDVVDLDGDGDGDVVISSITRSQIEWYENLGDPFTPAGWALHRIGDDYCHDLAVGDIDGDDNVDVTVFRKNSEVVWFEAPDDPRGAWNRHRIDSTSGEGLDVDDIDGDGDTDVAASRWWFENTDGTGTGWIRHTVASDWSTDCRDIIADVNGDGRKDIVLSHSEGYGRVSWFENPDWTERSIEQGGLDDAHSLEVSDFDLDGDADVFTGEMHTSAQKRVLVYQNNGAGSSWSRHVLATTGTHNARVADVNGDQKPDIVGKNYDGSKKVEYWENSVLFASAAEDAPPLPTELLGAYPNPFGGRTAIEFRLSKPAHVRLSVYDVKGRLVARLVDARRDIGRHAVDWDGRTASGRPARAGVYFCRLSSDAGAFTAQTRKLVILR